VSFSDVTVADMAAQAVEQASKSCKDHNTIQRLASAVQMPEERMLTREEVIALVDMATKKFESIARRKYEQGVKVVSADQQEKFNKFTEDFVTRKMNRGDCSYLS
jgi:hypothetical protein